MPELPIDLNWKSSYKFHSYYDDVMKMGPVMKGKVCMITGANSGIGKRVALQFAELGATVVMVCRSKERGEAALAEIKEKSGSESVELMLCDLSLQKSIRTLVKDFKENYDHLNVL